MTPLSIIRRIISCLGKEARVYKKCDGICQYCGYSLDDFDWIIHKGKYEDYPVHLYCEEQIEYEDSLL